MTKKSDKIVLGILVLFFIGLNGLFISALGTNDLDKDSQTGQLIIRQTAYSNFDEDTEDDEIDTSLTGNELDKASSAALNYVGEGRVTDSEIGDEEGYYEIEITLNNGKQVDVHLDREFNVLSLDPDDEEEEEN